jgi:hypothetical protein
LNRKVKLRSLVANGRKCQINNGEGNFINWCNIVKKWISVSAVMSADSTNNKKNTFVIKYKPHAVTGHFHGPSYLSKQWLFLKKKCSVFNIQRRISFICLSNSRKTIFLKISALLQV